MAKRNQCQRPLKVWTPTERQVEGANLLSDPDLQRFLFDGGARSGKTVAITRFIVNRAMEFPESKQFVGRYRQKDARFSVWVTFVEYLADYVPKNMYILKMKDLEVQFRNGSVIHFDGLDSKERVDFILGTEWLTIYLNEATQLSYDTLTTVMTRLSQKVSHVHYPDVYGIPKIIMDCNPKHSKHWIYQLCIRNPQVQPFTDPPIKLEWDGQWTRLHFTPYHNSVNLPNVFFQTLNNLPAVKRARMRDGIWKDNDGAVYTEFDEDTHVCERFGIPPDWTIVRGIDFGFTNPFVCLWGAIDPDGRLYIYDELYVKEIIVSEHAKVIKAKSEGRQIRWTTADWDAEDRATLHAEGIKTVQADKAMLAGIAAVKERLTLAGDGRPRLYIMEGCAPNLIAEFYDWIWDPNAPENKNKKETPVDFSDHAMDTLRYMVMRLDNLTLGTSKIAGAITERERRSLDSGF